MSADTSSPAGQAEDSAARRGLAEPVSTPAGPGYGWVLFAAILLFMVGTADVIEGLGAIDGSQFFQRHTHYLFGNLTLWGWVLFLLGVAEYVAGFGVLVKHRLARWFGVVVFAFAALAELLSLPATPLWSLCVIGLSVLGLYGLVVYGDRIAH